MKIKTVPISKINPASYNPRKDLKPDDPEYQRLVRSIGEFGCVEPLVWNSRTGNLVSGHQRYKVLLAQGVKEIPVSVVDLPLEKEKALNVALNKIDGQWDQDKLSELLAELVQAPEIDIELTGFALPEVENLLSDVVNDEDSEKFDIESELSSDLPVITKAGELIELGIDGQHRVFCGDVTNLSHVANLMGDQRASLCNTDPPYGVNYNRNNRPSGKRHKKSGADSNLIVNDDLTPQKYAKWFQKVADTLAEILAAGSPFYIWNSFKNFGLMHDLITNRGFKVASVLTWAKESFSPGFGDFNQQTEFCFYGWKIGARHRWYGPKSETTLWRVRRDRTQLYRHPTQKALELAERAIRNSSKPGDIVFDPFLGSGTTLIGAARLGRRCFGMEIEPKYCDVIIRRYISLAGEKAVKPEIADRYRIPDQQEVCS